MAHPNRQRYIDEFNQYPKHFPWPREITPPDQLVDAGFRWKYPIKPAGCNHPIICKHCHHFVDWSTVSERASQDPLGYHLFSSPSCPKAVQIKENKLEHARQEKKKRQQLELEQAKIQKPSPPSPAFTPSRLPNLAEFQLKQEKEAEKLAEQAKKAEQERIENLKLEQARIAQQQAEKKKKALDTRQKKFAEINQMQAAFRFRHPFHCKRCPEMFSSNTKLHTHIQACHTKKS
ncbi:MAG: hypothetical protein Q9223_007975, partial [Gallowayella weberi]